ncbi:hypothetical protein [Desertimonas flava]|uniref:hypothetical protein n=1 Tax=Desertimonas flava TaxID=2064846 RepID=UPI0013C480D5|nr:hypothetical protein [Desertimonas flava]
MADPRTDPISDLISLVAGPIAAVVRSFEQLRKGSDELMRGLENFNTTMESLNETAARVNRLLNEFEEPVRALMPQVTRTLKTADDLATRLSGPLDEVIPGLVRLAETLNSPVLAALPTDLGSFLDAINDLVHRLGPLSQLAETAGGMFGLKLPGMSRPAPAAPPPPPAEPAKKPAAKKPAARNPATKKPAAKKAAAKPTTTTRG